MKNLKYNSDLGISPYDVLLSKHIIAINAVEIEYEEGKFIRLHNAVGNIQIEGKEFMGAGKLGKISAIVKDGSTSPEGVNLTMAGLDPTGLEMVFNGHYQGGSVKIYFVLITEKAELNNSVYAVVDAHIVFNGLLDTMQVSTERSDEDGVTSTVSASVRNRLTDWKRGHYGRYNQMDHERNLTDEQKGDKFFEWIEETAAKEIEFTPFIDQ